MYVGGEVVSRIEKKKERVCEKKLYSPLFYIVSHTIVVCSTTITYSIKVVSELGG